MKLEFDTKQFACPDCGRMEMDIDFLNRMQTVQFGMGEPLLITSGFRCAAHNAAIGGSPKSQHLLGLAADVSCMSAAKRWLLIMLAVRNGLKGIGVGKDFVHLDLRQGTSLLWTYPLPAAGTGESG